MTTEAAPARPAATTRGGALLCMVVAVVLLVLSLRGLLWYSVDAGNNVAGTGFTFERLRSNADSLTAPVASAYFDWLAWTLLVALAVTGIGATFPTPLADLLRIAGFVFGAVGAIATYYALAQLFNAQHAAGGSSHGVWHNSSLGVYAALVGFVLGALAAARGPRRPS